MERKMYKCKQCGDIIGFEGICYQCEVENNRNRILSLPDEEIAVKIQQICKEIEENGELSEQTEQLFKNLVNFRDIDTNEIAEKAFKQNLFFPYELYKNAPPYVIKKMIARVRQHSISPFVADEILLCLAVHGGNEVIQAFLRWERYPRKLLARLPINYYAQEGGWSFDKNGKFIRVIFDKCYPMVKGTLEAKKLSPVKIGVKTEEKCPKCGCTIVNLIEIDGRDPRLDFIGIAGNIKAKCCPNCVMFSGPQFCRYTINGESEILYNDDNFMTENVWRDEEIDELSSNSYILGSNPVSLRYAADWYCGSSVGGFAIWIQDHEYELCPDCQNPMKYLAQIQWDAVSGGSEGYAYIEICTDCNIIAISHQQT